MTAKEFSLGPATGTVARKRDLAKKGRRGRMRPIDRSG